jgi:hypothetical protein
MRSSGCADDESRAGDDDDDGVDDVDGVVVVVAAEAPLDTRSCSLEKTKQKVDERDARQFAGLLAEVSITTTTAIPTGIQHHHHYHYHYHNQQHHTYVLSSDWSLLISPTQLASSAHHTHTHHIPALATSYNGDRSQHGDTENI